MRVCPNCQGSGEVQTSNLITCPGCQGKGTTPSPASFIRGDNPVQEEACSVCRGRRLVNAYAPCPTCKGRLFVD